MPEAVHVLEMRMLRSLVYEPHHGMDLALEAVTGHLELPFMERQSSAREGAGSLAIENSISLLFQELPEEPHSLLGMLYTGEEPVESELLIELRERFFGGDKRFPVVCFFAPVEVLKIILIHEINGSGNSFRYAFPVSADMFLSVIPSRKHVRFFREPCSDDDIIEHIPDSFGDVFQGFSTCPELSDRSHVMEAFVIFHTREYHTMTFLPVKREMLYPWFPERIPLRQEETIGRIDFVDFSADILYELTEGDVDIPDHARAFRELFQKIDDFVPVVSALL